MICEKCEALNALIDGYRRERDEARASVADAYRRGAEAMRVEVMQYLVRQQNEATRARERAYIMRRDEARRAAE